VTYHTHGDGNRYFLSPGELEPDPLFSEEAELLPLELSDLPSEEEVDPLLPDEPPFDDFFA
jgi:hypothetical protein